MKKALRKNPFKYRLHHDVELFERSYGYFRQYTEEHAVAGCWHGT